MNIKVYIIFFFLFFFSVNSYAEEVHYYTLKEKVYGYYPGVTILPPELTYTTELDQVSFYYNIPRWTIALTFNKKNREKLFEYMKKYEEWDKKAREKNILLTKSIGTLDLPIYFKHKRLKFKGTDVIAYVFFHSQSRNRHQFVLYFLKSIAQQNTAIVIKPESLYFDYQHVQTLKRVLKDGFIQTEVKKIQDKKVDLDEMFK